MTEVEDAAIAEDGMRREPDSNVRRSIEIACLSWLCRQARHCVILPDLIGSRSGSAG